MTEETTDEWLKFRARVHVDERVRGSLLRGNERIFRASAGRVTKERPVIDDFGICERLTDSFHSFVCVSGRAKSVTFLQTIS